MTLTNPNMTWRALTTGRPAAAQPPAPYQGAAGKGVVCPSPSAINHGGLFIERGSFRPEGARGADRRQLQL